MISLEWLCLSFSWKHSLSAGSGRYTALTRTRRWLSLVSFSAMRRRRPTGVVRLRVPEGVAPPMAIARIVLRRGKQKKPVRVGGLATHSPFGGEYSVSLRFAHKGEGGGGD